MYQLYVNKTNRELKLEKLKKVFENQSQRITDEVWGFNSSYYFCADRGKLKEFAKEMKWEWTQEVCRELDKIEAIKL